MAGFGDNTSATTNAFEEYFNELNTVFGNLEDFDARFTSDITSYMKSYNDKVAEAEKCRKDAEKCEQDSDLLRQDATSIMRAHYDDCSREETDEEGNTYTYWISCSHPQEAGELSIKADQLANRATELRRQEDSALNEANNIYNLIGERIKNYEISLNTIQIPYFRLPSDYTNYSKINWEELIVKISEELTEADNKMRIFSMDNFTNLVDILAPSNSYTGKKSLNVDFSNIISSIHGIKETIRRNINNSSARAEGLFEDYVFKICTIESENSDPNDYNLMFVYYDKINPSYAMQAYLDKLASNGQKGRLLVTCDGFPSIGNLCYVDIDEYRRTGVINLYSDKEGGLPLKTNNPDNPYSENLNSLIHLPQYTEKEIYYDKASEIITGDDVALSINNGKTITITLSDKQGNVVGAISLNKGKLDLPKDLYNNAYNEYYNKMADKTTIILPNNQLSMSDYNKYVKVGDCYIAGYEETRTDENGITQKVFVREYVDAIDGHEYPAISIEDYNNATNQHNAFVNNVNAQFSNYVDNIYNDPNALMELIEDSGYIPKSINDGTNILYEL